MSRAESSLLVPEAVPSDRISANAYRKITYRTIPFLFFCYVLSFLDRINIGFSQLQMKHDLMLSDTAYGLAAGVFFVGYLIFEIPSNLMLQKIGARKTICRIMVLWGLVSSATMFVRTPTELLCARFLLGVFEAGFAPGVLLYLTYWYPPKRQGHIVGIYMTAIVVAGLIAGPLSTNIMVSLDNAHGIRGWQWLFLLEGLPSVAAGIFAFFYLTDRPGEARWLSDSEKKIIEEDTSAGSATLKHNIPPWYETFRHSQPFVLAFCGFCAQAGAYVVFFWMPQILKGFTNITLSQVGLYAMIPYIASILFMIAWGKHSDAKMERRWHFSIPLLIATAGLVMVITYPHNLLLTMIAFTIVTATLMGTFPVFWAAVSTALPSSSRAAGIAFISGISSLGGLVSPALVGISRDATGKIDAGLYAIIALMILGAIAMRTRAVQKSGEPTAT